MNEAINESGIVIQIISVHASVPRKGILPNHKQQGAQHRFSQTVNRIQDAVRRIDDDAQLHIARQVLRKRGSTSCTFWEFPTERWAPIVSAPQS